MPKLVNEDKSAVDPIAAQPVVPINFLREIFLLFNLFTDMWLTLSFMKQVK